MAVGDPERKSASFFTIQDGRVGEEIRVTYRGPELPQGSVSFTKVGDDVYEGTLEAKDAGFHTYWEATYAVNEPKEYESVGFNPELLELAAATGGGVFAQHQTAELVDAVKKQSKDTVLERWHYQWPFVLAALLIFLLEICIRRALFFKG